MTTLEQRLAELETLTQDQAARIRELEAENKALKKHAAKDVMVNLINLLVTHFRNYKLAYYTVLLPDGSTKEHVINPDATNRFWDNLCDFLHNEGWDAPLHRAYKELDKLKAEREGLVEWVDKEFCYYEELDKKLKLTKEGEHSYYWLKQFKSRLSLPNPPAQGGE